MSFIDFLPQMQPGLFAQSSGVPGLPYGASLPSQIMGSGYIPPLPVGSGFIPPLPQYAQGMGTIPRLPPMGTGFIPQLPPLSSQVGPGTFLPGSAATRPIMGSGAIPPIPQQIVNNADDLLRPGTRLGGMDVGNVLSGGQQAARQAKPGSALNLSAIEAGAINSVDDIAAQATKGGRLSTMFKSPLGRGLAVGGGLYAAQGVLNPYFTQMEQQGGSSGLIGAGAKGALSGAAVGAGIGSIIPGVGTGIGAGIGAVGGAALGILGGGGSGGKADSEKIIGQLSLTNQITGSEANTLKTLIQAMKSADIPEQQIMQELVIPLISGKMQEQQMLEQQQLERQMYVQQVQDYFNAQQKSIDQSVMLGQDLAAPWIDQMNKDAELRSSLVADALSNSKYPAAYKEILQASQDRIGEATRGLSASYAQQLRTAPYYGMQQQQAQVLEQLRQQTMMQPPMAPGLVQQAQQSAMNMAGQTGNMDLMTQLMGA